MNDETNKEQDIEEVYIEEESEVEEVGDEEELPPAVVDSPETPYSDDDEAEPEPFSVMLLAESLSRILEDVKQVANVNPALNEATEAWLDSIKAAINHHEDAVHLEGAFKRKGSHWQQRIKDNANNSLGIARPRFKDNPNKDTLSGEAAVLEIAQQSGLGSQLQFPLWGSGLWVTMKAPSNSDLLMVQQQIVSEKTTLGRLTNGMIYSANRVYIKSALVNLAIRCISKVNLHDANPTRLKKWIKETDYHQLLWGLAAVIFPEGYPYALPCVAQLDQCQHTTRGILNINRLCWVDRASLSEQQLDHMSSRTKMHTKDDLKKYQANSSAQRNGTVTIKGGAVFHFKVPSLEDTFDSGFRWVDGVVDMVDKAFSVSPTGRERESMIINQSRSQILRQFGHWVDHIVTGNNKRIVDRKTIEMVLNQLSGDDEIVETIFTALEKYMVQSVHSVIGVPAHRCPECHEVCENTDSERFKHVIPLEVEQVFFTLSIQRLRKAAII